jgi:type II secretory pathway component GspD/PulD (secretin)
MTLRARPSITPKNKVDMIINVVLSQLTGDSVNTQPIRTEMETTTNMIVQDGQTMMLGGILFQKDSVIERKIPLIGDIPVIGSLFRHNETVAANNELIVFITPYVIDEPGNMLPETEDELKNAKEKLESVLKRLQTTLGTNNKAPDDAQE